jgi:hypothetical protein
MGVVTFTYRLRLTLQSRGETATGESAVRVRWTNYDYNPLYHLLPVGGRLTTDWLFAEAGIIRFSGSRPPIFALLEGPYRRGDRSYFDQRRSPQEAVAESGRWSDWPNIVKAANFRGEVELEERHWPALIWFRDLMDPRSVQLLEPGMDVPAFGGPVTVERASLIFGPAKLEPKIVETLPWLATATTRTIGGGELAYMQESQLANSIRNIDLKMGRR